MSMVNVSTTNASIMLNASARALNSSQYQQAAGTQANLALNQSVTSLASSLWPTQCPNSSHEMEALVKATARAYATQSLSGLAPIDDSTTLHSLMDGARARMQSLRESVQAGWARRREAVKSLKAR